MNRLLPIAFALVVIGGFGYLASLAAPLDFWLRAGGAVLIALILIVGLISLGHWWDSRIPQPPVSMQAGASTPLAADAGMPAIMPVVRPPATLPIMTRLRRAELALAREEIVPVFMQILMGDWSTDLAFSRDQGVATTLTATLVLPRGCSLMIRRGAFGLVPVSRIVLFLLPCNPPAEPTPAQLSANYRDGTLMIDSAVMAQQFYECVEAFRDYPAPQTDPNVPPRGPTWRLIFLMNAPWRSGQVVLEEGEGLPARIAQFGPMNELRGLDPVMVQRRRPRRGTQ